MKYLITLLTVLALTSCAGSGYTPSQRGPTLIDQHMEQERTRQTIRQELELREAMRVPPPPTMCC